MNAKQEIFLKLIDNFDTFKVSATSTEAIKEALGMTLEEYNNLSYYEICDVVGKAAGKQLKILTEELHKTFEELGNEE